MSIFKKWNLLNDLWTVLSITQLIGMYKQSIVLLLINFSYILKMYLKIQKWRLWSINLKNAQNQNQYHLLTIYIYTCTWIRLNTYPRFKWIIMQKPWSHVKVRIKCNDANFTSSLICIKSINETSRFKYTCIF